MEPIRISTIRQLAGAPYQYLRDVPHIQFHEGSPTDNAERLKLGLVDAALIPAVDFFLSGEYQSLGFGLGCRSRSQSMVLYAHDELEALESVRVYQCSSSSSGLLKILMHERCGRPLPFTRDARLLITDQARGKTGALVLHEGPGEIDSRFQVKMDLATAWHEQTKLPFVFLIWAVRPRVLSGAQLSHLTNSLHRCVAADRLMARVMAGKLKMDPALAEEFVADDRRFYLDDYLLAGLEEFLSRAQRLSMMRPLSYTVVKKSIFGSVVTSPTPSISFT